MAEGGLPAIRVVSLGETPQRVIILVCRIFIVGRISSNPASAHGWACVGPTLGNRGNRLEVKEGPDRRWIFDCTNMKAKMLRDDLDRYVVSQHFRGYAV